MLNVGGGSFKDRDLLWHHQAEKLEQLPKFNKVHTRQGLHQEHGLQKPGDTCSGSHFKTLDNFTIIFSSIFHVLEVIEHECCTSSDRNQAEFLLIKIKIFKFIFMLHLMLEVLAMSKCVRQDFIIKISKYY